MNSVLGEDRDEIDGVSGCVSCLYSVINSLALSAILKASNFLFASRVFSLC